MSVNDWDLTGLRAELADAAARVEQAKQGVDTTGMARPPRDPVEAQWLAERGALGVGEVMPAVAAPPSRLLPSVAFPQAIAGLYPELGGATPDLEDHAASIVLRVLNAGDPALQAATLAHYGMERVRAIAIERAHRLTNPAYHQWAPRRSLPARPAAVERIQALWQR